MYSPLSALLIFYSGRHFTFKLYRLYGLFSIKFLSTQHFNLSLFLSYLHSISSLFYFSNYYIYISVQPLLSLSLSLSLLQLTCELIWCGLSRTESIKVWRAKKWRSNSIIIFLDLLLLIPITQTCSNIFCLIFHSNELKGWERERERETKEEMKLFFDEGSFFSSATRKKLPNVYKSCLKWFH